MALPAFAPEDEEEVAGAGPGVAPLAPVSPPAGFPQMPGVPPGAPPPPAAMEPGGPPPGGLPDPNANLPPEALMQPGADLQPPAPTAPPPIPLTPDGKVDVAAAEKNALAEQGQLTAQGEDAARRKGEAEAKVADAESTAADKEATLAAQHAIDQQKVVDTAAANTQKWLDQAQQDAQKYRGMGLHDYWADKSTGDKVLAGLSMLFGAAGKTQGGPENNPGMGMIERAVERDFRSQQANIEKARSNVAVDKEQYDLGMTAKQQALADSNLKKANAYDAAAAQLVSFKLKQGVPLAQANTDANVVALRQKGLATRQETLQAIHAQNVADAHLDIERQRADAMTLRAQKYKMRGAGAGGGSDVMLKLAGAAQNGASQEQLIAIAVKGGIPRKDVLKTVTSIQKDPEKLAEMQYTDIHGNVQTANSPKAAKAAADQVAAAQAYKDAILSLRDHAKQYGRIINPLSDDAKERDRLQAEVLARGRKALELGVSKSNMELEHKAIGGSGVGLSRMPSIESLTKIAEEVDRVSDQRVAASARPGQRFGADATRISGAAPQSDRDLARSIKAKDSSAAPQYPVGTKAKTKDGKPVVMTASGWAPA